MEPPKRPARLLRWSLAVVLAAAVASVFGGAVGNRFVLVDDDINVYANKLINPPSKSGIVELWSAPYQQMYIPVTYTSLAAVSVFAQVEDDAPPAVNGVHPRVFHAANVGVHALTSLIVFALLLALLSDALPAFFGALLFAIHPVQVEPVAWASGMKDLSSGFFAFAALLAYVKFAQASGESDPRRRRVAALWITATLAYSLACLAKPSAVVIPLLAGLLDVGLLRRRVAPAVKALWLWVVIAVVIGKLATIQTVGDEAQTVGVWLRPAVAGDAVAFYLRQLVWPDLLALFYGRTPFAALEGGRAWFWTLLPIALLVAALLMRRRSVAPLLAFAIFVAGLLPVLGLVPFTHQEYSTVADRYLYLSLLGPALLLGWVLQRRPRIVAYALAAIALTALGVRASRQVAVWESTETLLMHTLRADPNSSFAYNNLGEIYARQGDIDRAIEHFREAVRLKPGSSQSRNNLGSYLGQTGEFAEAEQHLREAVRLDPDYSLAHLNLGSALMSQQKFPDAIFHVREAIRLEPGAARPQFLLGYLLELNGDPEGAIDAYRICAEADPNMVEASVRQGSVYLQLGRPADALRVLEAVVAEHPDHGEARAELGRALLTAGRLGDALHHLTEAQRLRPDLTYVTEMIEYARQGGRQ